MKMFPHPRPSPDRGRGEVSAANGLQPFAEVLDLPFVNLACTSGRLSYSPRALSFWRQQISGA